MNGGESASEKKKTLRLWLSDNAMFYKTLIEKK